MKFRLILLVLGFFAADLLGQDLHFERLDKSNKSRDLIINAVLQDRAGFVRVASSNGFSRFDGYELHDLPPIFASGKKLKSVEFLCLAETSDDRIYAGTHRGLIYLDPKTEKFYPSDSSLPENMRITALLCAKDSVLYVGTQNKGLFVKKPGSPDFRPISSIESLPKNILCLAESPEGEIFIGTKSGLKIYRPGGGGLRHPGGGYATSAMTFLPSGDALLGDESGGLFLYSAEHKMFRSLEEEINARKIRSLDVLPDGKIAVGTYGDGLLIWDRETGETLVGKHSTGNPFSLSNNLIRCFYRANDGRLFIGTRGGISVFNPQSLAVKTFRNKKDEPESLSGNDIWSFLPRPDGKIYVAVYGNGLNIYDPKTKKFQRFQHNPADPHSLPDNLVSCFIPMENGKIMLSTFGGGVALFDPKTERFKNFRADGKAGSLSNNRSISLVKSTEGTIYIGTYGGGLNIFDPETEIFRALTHNPTFSKSLSDNGIMCLAEGKDGKIYVGTYGGGLNVFNPKTQEFERYRADENDPKSLSSDDVVGLLVGSDGTVYVGTYGGGLNVFDPETRTFSYPPANKKLDQVINFIGESEPGILWLGTNDGLFRYVPAENSVLRFDESDGFLGSKYSSDSFYAQADGTVYVGGRSGMTVFDSKKIQEDNSDARAAITDLLVFNRSVVVSDSSILKKSANQAERVDIDYTDYVFAFEFGSFAFGQNDKKQFAYKLEGFDKDWIYTDAVHRRAVYTHIPDGTYTFKVRGANKAGNWELESDEIKVVIHPPWWLRTEAIFLWVILVIGGLAGIIARRLYSMKRQKEELERQVAERTAKVLAQNEELVQQKDEILAQRDTISLSNEALQFANEQVNGNIKSALIIQETILPSAQEMNELLGEHFLIYRPKDIVSGDFYWVAKASEQTVFVQADCTGHGVSGAFMTLIGSMLLNEIVKRRKEYSPSEILTLLDDGVRETLKKQEIGGYFGMEAGVFCFQRTESGISGIFAGAKSGMMSRSAGKFSDIRPSRRSIGMKVSKVIFENKDIKLPTGSMLYVGSDGFADQNNLLRKRFGRAELKRLLMAHADRSVEEQKQIFETNLDEFSTGCEQRDDILLIGIRV